MKIVFFVFLCVFSVLPQFAQSQQVQWATKVLKYSSQYSSSKSAAKQALGKPNSLPIGGDSPMAWAVEQIGENESWVEATLKLGYSIPMKIRQVAIAENCSPGAITRVILTDTDGDEHVIYTAEPKKINDKARMLNLFVPLTDYKVESLTLILQPGKVSGWNEIDAVGISDLEDSVKATIKLAPAVTYIGVPENLGSSVNSTFSEAIDAIAPDGKTLFFSRVNHPENVGGVNSGRDVWYSTMRPDSTWTPAMNIGAPINNEGNNYVNSISPDGNKMLLGNLYKEDGTSGGRGLSMTYKTQNGWSKPENLKIRNLVSKSNHAEYALSPDGKTILLSIEADETYGFNDLYATFLIENGEWSEPINLGENVNTAGNENGPFLAADGVTLYYSTNGLSGYGSNDVFITRRLDDTWTKWSEPENLGPGVNTAKFDAGYSLAASGSFAYFTSTANSLGEDDIFRIALPKESKPQPVKLVKGKVFDAKTNLPLESTITYIAIPDSSLFQRLYYFKNSPVNIL
ncbi:MAG: PD40 domain-containing protein [Ignavibacteria bacterium]|nr:PD40 domain-containing protein [Ignavibacteria bacterium]